MACGAGISRSASVIAAYLVRCGWDEPSAVEHLRRARPQVAPAPAMIESALRGVFAILDDGVANCVLGVPGQAPRTVNLQAVRGEGLPGGTGGDAA